MNGGDRLGSAHGTDTSPAYRTVSGELATALGTAAVLMALTIAAMVLLANSRAAGLLGSLFRTPILGVVVVGAGLTAGRYLGMRGLGNGNLAVAGVGAALSVGTYGLLGGAILSGYARAVSQTAVTIALAITTLIALVAAAVVYTTDRSFESWGRYSAGFFLVGLGAVFLGSFLGGVGDLLLLVGFGAFMLGFVVDLVYEIWHTSSRNRTPLANGFGIYVAFAGVFVHVLQLVMRYATSRG